jgi:hypothetical protein
MAVGVGNGGTNSVGMDTGVSVSLTVVRHDVRRMAVRRRRVKRGFRGMMYRPSREALKQGFRFCSSNPILSLQFSQVYDGWEDIQKQERGLRSALLFLEIPWMREYQSASQQATQ